MKVPPLLPLTLGYWNIRGVVQPIRFALEVSKIPYVETLYVQKGSSHNPPFDKSCWFDVKEKLGMSFPNLPYLFDGDLKLSQSQAILRHVARLSPSLELLGSTPSSVALVDELLSLYVDVKSRSTALQYNPGCKGPLPLSLVYGEGPTDLPATLLRFERRLEHEAKAGRGPFFVGGRLTVADLCMYEYFSSVAAYSAGVALEAGREEGSNILESVPRVKEFQSAVENIQEMKEYLASDRFRAVNKFNNQHAKFR